MAKKKTKKAAKSKEVLVVASKVKAYVKAKRMNCSSELIGAISDCVASELDRAVKRAQANKRKTVKACDV